MKRFRPFIAALLVVVSLVLGKGLLIPLSLAMLIAFLMTLPVRMLSRCGLPRPVSVIAVQLSLLVVTGTAFWLCVSEARDFSGQSPQLEQRFDQRLRSFRDNVHSLIQGLEERIRFHPRVVNPRQPPALPAANQDLVTQNLLAPVLSIVEHLGLAVVDLLGTAAIVFILSFFLLYAWDDLVDRMFLLAGKRRMFATALMLQEAATGVRRFLLLNLAINLGVGAGFSVILYCFGIPQPVLWGLLASLLRFIPSVGIFLAILPPVMLSIILSDGWTEPLLLLAVIGGFDLVVSTFLEPVVYGGGIGVSAVAIILSAFFWTWCWGPIGLILAPPFTVCLVVFGRYIPQLEFFSILFGQSKGSESSFRFFQSLLGSNEDEARKMAAALEKSAGVIAVFDRLFIPALVAAERDLRRKTLSQETYGLIIGRIETLIKEVSAGESEDRQQSQPSPQKSEVLVIPLKYQSEYLCGQMVAQALSHYGIRVQVMSDQALMGEAAQFTKENKIPLVILSTIAEDHDTEIRYALKRFESWKGVQPAILAARWGDSLSDTDRITGAKLFVVTVFSIREIVEKHLHIFPKKELPEKPLASAAM